MPELADKNAEIVIITIFQMFKKSRDMEDIFKRP